MDDREVSQRSLSDVFDRFMDTPGMVAKLRGDTAITPEVRDAVARILQGGDQNIRVRSIADREPVEREIAQTGWFPSDVRIVTDDFAGYYFSLFS